MHYMARILGLVERVGSCATKKHSIAIFEILGNICKQDLELPVLSEFNQDMDEYCFMQKYIWVVT